MEEDIEVNVCGGRHPVKGGRMSCYGRGCILDDGECMVCYGRGCILDNGKKAESNSWAAKPL